MNEREAMQRFLEGGYVITNPNKFYREVRAVGLDYLLNELELNNNRTNAQFDYKAFEDDILSYLREIRSLVVNDENYNSVESDLLANITNLIREVGDKYVISNRADEERLNINLNIASAREESDSLNRDLASAEENLASARRRQGELRRELNELNNSAISNVERTQR